MKLTQRLINQITKTMNDAGWRGYKKELAERTYGDNMNNITFNRFISQQHDDEDLWDKAPFIEHRNADLDAVDGAVKLDVWLYDRNEWLVDIVDVFVYQLGRKIIVSMNELDHAARLRAAVSMHVTGDMK